VLSGWASDFLKLQPAQRRVMCFNVIHSVTRYLTTPTPKEIAVGPPGAPRQAASIPRAGVP
jgi:hypothetical protein